MREPVCTNPFSYEDTPERRVLNLERDRIPCVPALGYSHYMKSRASVVEHLHPGCIEITLCLRGSLVFECGGTAYRLLPGKVFVTQPDEWHRLSTNPKRLVMYWMFFRISDSDGRPLLDLPKRESDALRRALRTLPRHLSQGNERLRVAFQRLFRIHDSQPRGATRSLALRGGVLDLLLALTEAAQTEPRHDDDLRIEGIIRKIRANPEKDYPIAQMMKDTALSESRLNSRFKQMTGLPPYAFLLATRMYIAQQRLMERKESVTEIAQSLGFSSSQHFAMQFKREFGITPSSVQGAR